MASAAVWPQKRDVGYSPVVGQKVVSASLHKMMTHSVETIKRRSDFLRVSRSCQSNAAPGLVLQASFNSRYPNKIRIGFTATRRIGGSVKRNRARRRLRAAVERVMPHHAAIGYDYVLVARIVTIDRPFESLIQDLETALKRLKVWRES